MDRETDQGIRADRGSDEDAVQDQRSVEQQQRSCPCAGRGQGVGERDAGETGQRILLPDGEYFGEREGNRD